MDSVVQQNYKPMSVYKKRYFLHSAHRAYGGFHTKRTRRDVTRWASRLRCKYRVCIDEPFSPHPETSVHRFAENNRPCIGIYWRKKVSDNGFLKCVVAKTVEFLLRDPAPTPIVLFHTATRSWHRKSCSSKGAVDGIWIISVTSNGTTCDTSRSNGARK